jgi:hypothetical protein
MMMTKMKCIILSDMVMIIEESDRFGGTVPYIRASSLAIAFPSIIYGDCVL